MRPALLIQSRRGGSSVSESNSSRPCFRSQSRSSTPSGRARAARSGFSIQVNPGGWGMVAHHGVAYLAKGLPRAEQAQGLNLFNRKSYSTIAERFMPEASPQMVGLFPHLGIAG